jgi:hypothetical protein
MTPLKNNKVEFHKKHEALHRNKFSTTDRNKYNKRAEKANIPVV